MRRSNMCSPARFALLALTAAALAGCSKAPGSFDQTDSVTDRLGNLLAFNKLKGEPMPDKGAETLECPEIIVLDGTAAHRVYNGAESNETLRYQYSLGDVARQCLLQGNQIAMKIGVQGQVLLGPAGAPGNFSIPIRIAIVKQSDSGPLISKLYTATANVAAGQTAGSFAIVTEPLMAPFIQQHTGEDYTIKVGIDAAAPGGAPATGHGRKRQG